MTLFYVHLIWFLFFSVVSVFFLIVAVYTTLNMLTMSISVDIFSSWFRFVVRLITSVIMVYSYFYISPYSKPNYFIWLTVFFVLSMLILINMSNFLFIMLGWDGLGLVSFFLIVYYQNYSSISSGLFTVLINRIGDCFFIVSISLFMLYYSELWVSYDTGFYYLVLSIFITFITKRAIFPFSSWLPIAIAAPTPISALVHSSTLVTAGLYLSMRFSFLFYSSLTIINLFLILSVFTSFYAGINSIFETDMKKLIALSTLSHLGFIGLAFSCGLLYLSFFHLLVHALFKSSLFIAIGDIITNLFHSQDIRFLSSGVIFTPASFYTMIVRLLNLLGMPIMSGYFSKDLVLETCNFTFSSQFIVFLVFLNVIFTYYYTYKLFYFSFRTLKFGPYVMINKRTLTHTICLLGLSVLSIFFGSIWLRHINFFVLHVSVPLVWKLTPYILNGLVFTYLVLNLGVFRVDSKFAFYYFSNMIFLSVVSMAIVSNLFLNLTYYLSKSSEFGLYRWLLNNSFVEKLRFLGLFSFKTFSLPSFTIVLISFYSLILFCCLLCNIIKYG